MEDDKKILSTEETENNINEAKPADTLDALRFDAEEDSAPVENEDSGVDFESFMAEYRSIIKQNIAESEKEEAKTDEEKKKEYEEEYLVPTNVKPAQKKKAKKRSAKTVAKDESENKGEWNDDITLEPEEYDDTHGDNSEFVDELPIDETPDFNLGESADERFQLSINFDGEEAELLHEEADDDEKDSVYDPEKPRAIDWVFDIAEMFVIVLAVVMLLVAFVFKHSVVEGESMNNTLEDGDHLIISNLFYTPERGDIIVFEDYSTVLKKAVVKRVIGLPGETVEVKVDGSGNVVVYINGELLDEEYAYNAKDCDITKDFAPVTLGEDEIFVMGDNRYHSTDSRYSGVGPIKIDSILGKVLIRFFPFDSFGTVD